MPTSKRPFVVCHMMSTIDGKIASGTGEDILEQYFKLYTKTEDLLGGQAWMCGRKTMEMFAEGVDSPIPVSKENIEKQDYIADPARKTSFIAVDTNGVLRWKSNSITLSNVAEQIPLAVIVSETTPNDYLAYLRNLSISYLFGGENDLNFNLVFQKIKSKLGIDRLLLEGGGTLNGSVLAQDLVDEISLLLTPNVLNRSSAPSLFDRKDGEIDVKKFSLISIEQLEDGVVRLRYRRAILPS